MPNHLKFQLFSNLSCYLSKLLILTCCLAFNAWALQFSALPVIDLSLTQNVKTQKATKTRQWQHLVSQEEKLYLSDELGNLHLVDVASQEQTNLVNNQAELSQHRPLQSEPLQPRALQTRPLSVKKHFPKLIRLDTFALHPNFANEEKQGHLTLYTSHLEALNNHSKTKRIVDLAMLNNISFEQAVAEKVFNYELVIAEWRLKNDSSLALAKQGMREVLRIPVPSKEDKVVGLAFNRYVKPWQVNYGLLFVALADNAQYANNALFSGAILRVKPDKFGFHSYSVPASNPFLANSELNNELMLYGVANIQHFGWLKNNESAVVIHYQQKDSADLALVDFASNFAESSTPLLLFSSTEDQLLNMALPAPQAITTLGKQLFVLEKKSTWLISSISQNPPHQRVPIWQFTFEQISPLAQLGLHVSDNGQLLLFNKSSGLINRLQVNKPALNSTATTKQQAATSPSPYLVSSKMKIIVVWFLWVAVIGLIIFCYKLIFKQRKREHLYHSFARLTLNKKQNKISFYKRHQNQACKTIPVERVKEIQVLLNEQPLLSISAGHYFSQQQEQELRLTCSREKQVKMIHQRLRCLQLVLTDVDDHQVPVCVYFREGYQRLTKENYTQIVDLIVEWLWFFSRYLNPELSAEAESAEAVSNINLLAQDDENVAENSSNINGSSIRESGASESDATKDEKSEQVEQENIAMITALDKLVKFKQQGFITEQEFVEAKAKILQDISQEM